MRLLASAFVLGLLFWAFPLEAQDRGGSRVYPRIDLTAREAAFPIRLNGTESRLEIRQVIVGRPQHAAAQIQISAPKRAPTAPKRRIDIVIGDIQSRLGSDTRLIVNISDNVQVGKLEIVRNVSDAADPIVDIAMAETASASEVRLAGGHYRSILLHPDGLVRPAIVSLSQLSLTDLTIKGQADEAPQPISLAVNAEVIPPDDRIDNNLVLANLQLRGDATIALTPQYAILRRASSSTSSCVTKGKSLAFEATRLMVGDVGGKLDRSGNTSAFRLQLDPTSCLTLKLNDINMFGDIEIKGGVLNKIALDNIDDHIGGHFQLDFAGVQSIMFTSASLNKMTLGTTDQTEYGPPEIDQWGSVRVNESVSLPMPVYDALYNTLKKSPDDSRSAAIRNFLVDVRWKSFSSEKPEKRAAPIVLFDVLDSDAHQIFGGPLAGFLWLTTGYGQNVWHLILCLAFLLSLPLIISAVVWVGGRIAGRSQWHPLGAYYGALLTGDNQALAQSSQRLRYALPIHRLLIAVEIGLATLFIQNAILTGS